MSVVSPTFTDIVVAIHGIGAQQRSATVRSVTVRLAMSDALSANAPELPVAPQPLGYFHSVAQGATAVRAVDEAAELRPAVLAGIGFSEVYWADIPQRAAKDLQTLEETKAWARTVVARAKAHCLRAAKRNPGEIVPPDFNLAAEVLEEIIDTVAVLENLTFLANKAGLFRLDLRSVLEEYLGDVQLVAEFGNFRSEIIGRFNDAMKSIHAQHPHARLHLVAHSEGTVVSFLGLLQAMSGQDPDERPAPVPAWLSQVRGYMTLGSPIDKHLLLWPRLWCGLDPKRSNHLFTHEKIRWRNYYDYGDPVGFRLDTARAWLAWQQVRAFEFSPDDDIGFARYPLPGKAHNDYWDDSDVFEHFVNEVVKQVPGGGKKPESKQEVAFFSPLLPYALSFLILGTACFILYKAVTHFMFPEPGAIEESMLLAAGVRPESAQVTGLELFANVFGVAMLVGGTTLLARLPRLAAGGKWKFWGVLAFVFGCGVYGFAVQSDSRQAIGQFFDLEWLRSLAPSFPALGPTLGVWLVALIVGLFGLAAARKVRNRNDDRRQRWFWRGMRPLIFCGAVGVALIVGWQMAFPPAIPAEVPASVVPLYKPAQPVWPLVLATAAFLYLWWLSALIFDLGFVWHRYIRRSVAVEKLSTWKPYDFAVPPPQNGVVAGA